MAGAASSGCLDRNFGISVSKGCVHWLLSRKASRGHPRAWVRFPHNAQVLLSLVRLNGCRNDELHT